MHPGGSASHLKAWHPHFVASTVLLHLPVASLTLYSIILLAPYALFESTEQENCVSTIRSLAIWSNLINGTWWVNQKTVYKLSKDNWKAQGILPHVGKPLMCLREWTWLCHLYSMYSLSAPPVPTSMIPCPLSLLNWTQKCDNQSINIFSFAFEHSS
jgi:hypothetical protein